MSRCRSVFNITLILALLGFLPMRAAAQKPAGDAAFLPLDGFSGAWKKNGPMKVFRSEDLYGHIDGGAEAFLELGFDQLTVQKYQDGANELTVELYRMTDPTAARGIYLARCGKETPDPALKDRHTASRNQILLQRNRYYLVLYNTAGGAANAPILAKAAQAIVPKLPADAPVPALALLPPAGLVPGSARIIRGPVSLQALYTLGDGDILQLGGKITGAAGDYKDAAGASTLIVVDYPSPAAATAAFKHLKANLDTYLKPASATDSRLVFQDYEKKFGVASVNGKRLEIRLHLAKPPA
ncbi:MAG: hypothetical protein MUE61_17425 [Vicinamibacterales bacterium]|jgi:hypothetical protein|nr:hypothetical protein [Vicinamibacterales bacterium]